MNAETPELFFLPLPKNPYDPRNPRRVWSGASIAEQRMRIATGRAILSSLRSSGCRPKEALRALRSYVVQSACFGIYSALLWSRLPHASPMPKTPPELSLEHYAPVADRLTLFYARYPTGRVVTQLVSRDELEIVFKASVFRSADEKEAAATGWAAERIGDGDINTVACLENTETSAVGRALANLGLTASRNRPSLEEIEKASRVRARLARDATKERPLRVVAESGAPFETPLQRLAERVKESLELLADAERAGLSQEHASSMRAALAADDVQLPSIERAERLIRRWLQRRLTNRPDQPA
jgi:hypothetical protein